MSTDLTKTMTPHDYARDRFDEEIESAKEHLGRYSVHWEMAQVLADRYDFALPDLEKGIQAEPPSKTNGTVRSGNEKTRSTSPSLPKMVLKYFKVHQQVGEPKDVDAWAKAKYPQATIKGYSIGQTMHRMSNDGRLHGHRYPDQQSSVYGLPAWAKAGSEEGFESKYLPDSLRPKIQLGFAQQGSGHSVR